ncbi:MAG: LysR family transcriptional regulator [Verrucomicrobiota bacterium]
MQIETLRLFCDLVEAGSFSIAAEKHHISQSAVSQRIAALEKELGVTLLVRGRNTEATAEGNMLLSTAHEMLETFDDFRARLRSPDRAIAGKLQVATVYSIGLHELPPYLKWFRDHYPDVEVRVEYRRANQVYEDVELGRADLGLVAYPENRAGLIAETFWQDELVLICTPGHEFARKGSVTLGDLEKSKFVSFEPDLPTRIAIDAMFAQAGVSVDEVMELDNVELVKRAVELENAVSIVPQRTAYAEVEGGRLAQATLVDSTVDTSRPLGVIRRSNGTETENPAMLEFVELLETKRLF